MATKIVFLDIDGVLNSHQFYTKNKHDIKKEIKDKEDWLRGDIDPDACRVLKSIVDKTDAKIVISSTWRLNHYGFLVSYLDEYGIKVIGKTGRGCPDCLRGNEILRWIKNNEELCGEYHVYKNYVILDDDSDMLYWQKDNFVHINSRVGLTSGHVHRIVSILNKE